MSGEQLSAQERQTWEEQKRTRDMVSNMIGKYLLKGCRMLGSSCGDCGTVLLQTREGKPFCTYCTELQKKGGEASHASDGQPSFSAADPLGPLVTPASSSALNLMGVPLSSTSSTIPPPPPVPSSLLPSAARAASNTPPSLSRAQSQPSPSLVARPIASTTTTAAAGSQRAPPRDHLPNPTWPTPETELTPTETVTHCEAVLFAKVQWSMHELKRSQSVEQSIQLCHLITACGEALRSLQELRRSPTTDTTNP